MIQIIDPFEKKEPIDAIPLGIDLGTTHTLAAYIDQNKKIQFIKWDNNESSRAQQSDRPIASAIPRNDSILLPSVVSFIKNTVGQDNDFASTKRFMTDAFKTLKDEKSALDVAVEILRHVKQKTEEQTQKEIAHVVITVPAYFDDAARQATKIAGEKAGLVVRRIINEPTAAALAYNIDKEGIYAVYDFGGGTFDLSVLRMQRGVFQVLSTIGDLRLGGDDIDTAILEKWDKDESYRAIAKAAKESGDVENFDEVIKPFIDRTLKLSAKGLSDARVSKLDGVILVGGSTRLKGLHEALKEFFKTTLYDNENPDLVVAKGAAIQSYALLHGANHVLIDVNPLSIGLEIMGGVADKIIPRNSPLPVMKEQMFTTYEDGQTGIEFHIVQGEREMAEDNRSLARFTLSGITPLPKGHAKIKVQFFIDSDGLLTVNAIDTLSGSHMSVEIKPTFGLSPDDIKAYVLEGQSHAKEDVEKQMWTQKSLEAKQILEAAAYYKCDTTDVMALKTALNNHDLKNVMTYCERIIYSLRPLIEKKLNEDLKKALVGQVIGSYNK